MRKTTHRLKLLHPATVILDLSQLGGKAMAQERIWDKFLTERDKEVFKSSGYGAIAGGGKKPAL